MNTNFQENRIAKPKILLGIADKDESASFQSFASSFSLSFIFINHFSEYCSSVWESLQATKTYLTSNLYSATKEKES